MGGTIISPGPAAPHPRRPTETNFSRPQTARSIAPASKRPPSILEHPSQSSDSLCRRRDSGLATSITADPPTRRGRIPVFDSSSAALQAPPKTAVSIADGKSIRSQMAPSILSPEDEVLSLKVRSLYDSGVGIGGSDTGSQFSKRTSSAFDEGKRMSRVSRSSFVVGQNSSGDEGIAEEDGAEEGLEEGEERGEEEEEGINEVLEEEGGAVVNTNKSQFARAGGTEDWEDIDGRDVDRYGFINPTYLPSTPTDPAFKGVPPTPTYSRAFAPPKRISTALHLHSTTPQKRTHALHLRLSPFSNPAPEMLRSPLPGASAALREKEHTRAKKWRDMAVVRKRSERGDEAGRGGGCEWGFVTRDPKLVSRTWKGIPDCWRAAAWHAFLTASAKRRGIGRGDAELIEIYAEFTLRPSADDVQIDLDVPRTISSHIMFRRRYRGGQRLLFRVLHALSLYFLSVGYVQGMASLAATLLCYYDEETAFVMLVRMFELRGLEKLYQAGFGGLMAALEEFESGWIKGGSVSRKLSNLGIGPTAYGTRWYLTLFNYSMPFAAQLRVWDVFMLLGDPDPVPITASTRFFAARSTASLNAVACPEENFEFGGTLDILHATSAALIDSMKEIIVKNDFEGVMKVLTSWIPVKDEELLMKVAKAEWKMRKRRRTRGGSVSGPPGRASLG